MQDGPGDRDPASRRWLVLGIVLLVAIIVSGTLYVVGRGADRINVGLIVAVAVIGLALTLWTALYG